mmetsp:Transcript_43661/g.102824  ORF Transcript_43661/g.102824 Transcript_43661/m.102824 type:complete len:231 (+) Transcript_43661:1037-1729(+)
MRLGVDVVHKRVLNEPGGGDDEAFDDREIDVVHHPFHHLIVELVQGLVTSHRRGPLLPRDRHLDFLAVEGQRGRDEADVRQALLHDHGGEVGLRAGVARAVDHLRRDRVPPRLPERELAVRLELEGVVSAQLHVLVLDNILALEAECGSLSIEVNRLNLDGELDAEPLAADAPGRGLGDHLADRLGAHRVADRDEVVEAPHVLSVVRDDGDPPPLLRNLLVQEPHRADAP